MALLEIDNLRVSFPTQDAVMQAVDGVSFSVEAGEVLGIVGESGSGKSVAMLAVMSAGAPAYATTSMTYVMGEGADIGAAVAYLASREAGYVTGQTIHVNGGMAMI